MISILRLNLTFKGISFELYIKMQQLNSYQSPLSRPIGIGFRDFILLVTISLFSAYVTTEGFYRTGTLYWDNGLFFGFFRDNLHSLNEFGEFAWWFPHKQFGWPAYYYSVLGDLSFFSPVQMSFCAASFLLGQFGFHVSSFQPWFLFEIGFVSPLIVNVGVFLLTRQIFPNKLLSFFAVTLAAFSPGVFFNLSDPGFLEPVAYSLFFAAAYIQFLRGPTRKHFYILGFTCCLLALNLNFPFIFWNALAVPLFLLVSIFFFRGNFKEFKLGLGQLNWWDWALCLLAIIICSSPSLVVFSQVGELIRTRMGQKIYDLKDLYVGNPLEMISVGWPGFGFDLNVNRWQIYTQGSRHIGITYLGLLCLPLTLVGLIFGRQKIRMALLMLLISSFTIVCLSAYSPIFSLLLVWDTPLRANNHYGDAFLRSGGYLLLIIGAALGMDAIWRQEAARKYLSKIFILWILFSAGFMVWMLKDQVTVEPSFGFFLVLAFFFYILIHQLYRSKNQKTIKQLLLSLIILTIVDISTISYFHVRHILESPLRMIDETPAGDRIGMAQSFSGEYSNSILMLRPLYEMTKAGFEPAQIPFLKLFTAAHPTQSLKTDLDYYFSGQNPYPESIALDAKAFESEDFRDFLLVSPKDKETHGQVEILRRTYSSLVVKTKSEKKALLFVRDGFSPFWQAFTKDQELPLVRALSNFKVAVVPPGENIIAFQFSPPWVRPALAAAYLVIFIFIFIFLLPTFGIDKRLRAARERK